MSLAARLSVERDVRAQPFRNGLFVDVRGSCNILDRNTYGLEHRDLAVVGPAFLSCRDDLSQLGMQIVDRNRACVESFTKITGLLQRLILKVPHNLAASKGRSVQFSLGR